MKFFLSILEKMFYSIKNRLIVILLLSTMLPLLTLGVVSSISISAVFQKKINNGVQNSLHQEGMALQSALDNLSYASVQLSYEGSIGQKFYRYLTEMSQSVKLDLRQEISNNLTLVNFTNPNVGVMFYDLPDSKSILFENLEVNPKFSFTDLPVFTTYKNLIFNGPHPTSYRYGKTMVFSMLRQVDVAGIDKVNVYLETNFTLFQTVLNKNQLGMNAFHLLINNHGTVVYSDDPGVFPSGKSYAESATNRGYSYFIDTNLQGWQLAVAIPNGDIKQEVNKWLQQFMIIGGLAVLLSLWLGYAIFKMIYDPITRINKEVQLLSNPFFVNERAQTHTQEFDLLLGRFYSMRQRVAELIDEVKQEERLRGELEVEKLLHQINPHFLYNTLNTIQWIARINDQEEIDRLITVFSNVLQYNLGKEGSIVMINDEIEVINDYITLQRIRYNYKFDVRIQVDPSLSGVQIPRFILQPLVENSLYHGMRDDCIIEVIVSKHAEEEMTILVRDNGKGMKPEVLGRLFAEQKDPRKRTGMGIGLQYVLRVLKTRYGDRLRMDIQSHPDQGTLVRIQIPIHIESGGIDHERIDRG